ncbi:MFS transporter [Streptomyces olivaceiscleroticus]|uniref:MFS transporter n=1 Tax=Streptomyces olivaceiscleroticus TaxID=68245 RepID=A0ABN1B6M0_9ACTN
MVHGPGTTEARSAGARIWLLALGMFAIGTDLFIVSGLLPAVGHDLRLSTAAAGQTVTAFAITYAIAAPVLAGVTSKVDRRVLLFAVLLVFAVGNALSALAPSFAVLLTSRIVAGAGAALFAATASAVAARIAVPERRGRALAIVYAGMTSAIALGVPLGNAIGNLSSWRWAFAFVVLLALITAVGLWFTLPPLPGSAGTGIRDRLTALRIGRVPTAMLTTTLWVVGTFVVYTYLGSILVTVTHASASDRTWLLLAFGIGSFAGVMAGGRLADRTSPTAGLTVTIALLAAVLAGLGIAVHSLPGAAVALAIWGLVHWSSFPLIQHRLLAIGGRNADMLLALNNSAVYIGQTVAAVVGGLLVGAGLLSRLPLAGAAFEVLALLALAVSAGAHRSATHPETEVAHAERQTATS